MAAKLLQSLTDDNPDLQKQIGCMTGIFQIFDRQHVITPRRITGHGDLRSNGSAFETESNTIYNRSMPMEKQSRRHVLEKQRISTESSRASFSSSSRSSSFSSLDLNKNAQHDASSFDRITFPENPPRDAGMSRASVSPLLGRQSFDLREVVKESMYRESQGLPAKPIAREEVVKLRDSPRPLHRKERLPVDLKESFSVLAKPREAPWFVNEPRELSRSASYHAKEGSFFSITKEAPRFSYDGKDMRHEQFDSRDNSKSSFKPPRLSLDSRESSMRSLKSSRNGGHDGDHLLDQRLTSGSQSQTRPSSVVAKLMGLEAMPSSGTSGKIQDSNSVYRTSNITEPSRPIQISIPSKTLWKEPSSPRWKVPDSSVKPVSRLPMEPAPWKQVDGNRVSPKAAIKGVKAPVRNPNTIPTVFSEIEKRLKNLEFSQSGKDLRALKQILEAMQAKGLLESQKEEDASIAMKRDLARRNTNSTPLVDSRKPQNDQVYTSAKRGTSISRSYESPIVIMKPAKLIEKSGIAPSSVISLDELSNNRSSANSRAVKGQIPTSSSRENVSNDVKGNNRTSRTTQTSARSSQNAKEGSSSPFKSSGSISPRMHQKKQELEKRSKPPIPPTDSGRSRKPSNKQAAESSSPGGRRRPKTSSIQQNEEQSSDISNESRHLSNRESDYSAQSDGSILSESLTDIEVNSFARSPELSNCQSPSMKTANISVSCIIEKKFTHLRPEDQLEVEHPAAGPEYPSPVSVLDAVLDMDDSPSPVKHRIKTARGVKSHGSGNIQCSEQHNTGVSTLTDAAGFVPTSEVNRKKLQKIENLVQKLQRLNSSHDEAQTDYIASLCENTNPDHRYISEILLASGFLLSDLDSSLTSFQFHPSGHPINPELFVVLEQTKASNFTRDEQKVHRKLIFDTVNEVLARKLAALGLSPQPWMTSHKLARKTLNAQKLLRELCLETEELQSKKSKCHSGDEEEDDALRTILWEDVMHQSESWTNYKNDVSGMVLDLERLVFKDLVNEIVIGEAPGLENKPVRRRQLFAE